MAGAPLGNNNSYNGSIVKGAIRRALAENAAEGRESLLLIAKKLIEDAEGGSIRAANLLFDRIEGKATQTIDSTIDMNVKGGLDAVYDKLQPTPEA